MIQLLCNLFVLIEYSLRIMDFLDLFKNKLNDMLSLLHGMSESDQLTAISLWEKSMTAFQDGFLSNKGTPSVQSLFGLEFVGSDSLVTTNVAPFEESGDTDEGRTDTCIKEAIAFVGALPVDTVQSDAADGDVNNGCVTNASRDEVTSQDLEENTQQTLMKTSEETATGEEGGMLEGEDAAQSMLKEVIDESKEAWALAGETDNNIAASELAVKMEAGDVAPENSGRGGSKKGRKTKKKTKKEKRQVVKETREEKCTCGVCGKALANPSNLRVHLRVHNGVRPYKCSICDKSFSIRPNMRRHEKTHSGEKPWECTQCFKRFTEKKSLKVHFRSHTGEKPFECKQCGKCFTQAGTLQSHMHVHTGWKGHLCDFCGKSFRQKSQLRLHEFRHTNNRRYICQVCTRSFISKGELDRHSMQHTGERPYLCTLCPKMFTRLTYLKEHMNSHTGQKPYQCPHCSETFQERSAYSKHVKRHEAARSDSNGQQQVELHAISSKNEFDTKDTYLLYISPPEVLGMLSSQLNSQGDDVVGGIDDGMVTGDAVISVPVLAVKDANFDDAQQMAAAMETSANLESVLESSDKFVFVQAGEKVKEPGDEGTEQFAIVELLQTPS